MRYAVLVGDSVHTNNVLSKAYEKRNWITHFMRVSNKDGDPAISSFSEKSHISNRSVSRKRRLLTRCDLLRPSYAALFAAKLFGL